MAEPTAGSDPTPGTEGFMEAIDPDALKVVRRLLAAGHEAYLVGGCVRDLYLGRRPKDFDVATSATPEAIRKLFRNSRIIGRRFKLAHVFFGPKIIETSTFRTAPTATDEENPLIVTDNEWGTVEDDARRRDFTMNGLFYDVETRRIVDFVDGLDDLDARLVRTIGHPALRFREDPVRMIRAAKFAARLDFRFDPATWEALVQVAPDITKSSRARLLEEIYKLLRGGAARRSLELMLECGLFANVMPEYVQLFHSQRGRELLLEAVQPQSPPQSPPEPDGDEPPTPAQLLWRFLGALDEYVRDTDQIVHNGVLQAVLFAPLVEREIGGARQGLDRALDALMTPVGAALGVARRDRELARQILTTHRRVLDGSGRRRRPALAHRQYFHDALVFLGLAVRAHGGPGSELDRWRRLAEGDDTTDPNKGRRRRRGARRRGRGGAKPASNAATHDVARDG